MHGLEALLESAPTPALKEQDVLIIVLPCCTSYYVFDFDSSELAVETGQWHWYCGHLPSPYFVIKTIAQQHRFK